MTRERESRVFDDDHGFELFSDPCETLLDPSTLLRREHRHGNVAGRFYERIIRICAYLGTATVRCQSDRLWE